MDDDDSYTIAILELLWQWVDATLIKRKLLRDNSICPVICSRHVVPRSLPCSLHLSRVLCALLGNCDKLARVDAMSVSYFCSFQLVLPSILLTNWLFLVKPISQMCEFNKGNHHIANSSIIVFYAKKVLTSELQWCCCSYHSTLLHGGKGHLDISCRLLCLFWAESNCFLRGVNSQRISQSKARHLFFLFLATGDRKSVV